MLPGCSSVATPDRGATLVRGTNRKGGCVTILFFCLRRPNQVRLGSEYAYTNPENPQSDEVQRRGFSPAPQNPAEK